MHTVVDELGFCDIIKSSTTQYSDIYIFMVRSVVTLALKSHRPDVLGHGHLAQTHPHPVARRINLKTTRTDVASGGGARWT